MLAYLAMMAPRLVEFRRVLKSTGSIYLHCDPTASHYLKMLMDAVFGAANFCNEIVWERTYAHNMRTKTWPRTNDVLLFSSKSRAFFFDQQFTSYGPEQLGRFKVDENGRLYKGENLTFSTRTPGDSSNGGARSRHRIAHGVCRWSNWKSCMRKAGSS